MRYLLWSFITCIFFFNSSLAANMPANSTVTKCPATIAELKQAMSFSNNKPVFSLECQKRMLAYIEQGKSEWIENSELLNNINNAYLQEKIPLSISLAIPMNPVSVLKLAYNTYGEQADMRDFCAEPLINPTESEIRDFNMKAIRALEQAHVPNYLKNLRKKCIASFEEDLQQTITY